MKPCIAPAEEAQVARGGAVLPEIARLRRTANFLPPRYVPLPDAERAVRDADARARRADRDGQRLYVLLALFDRRDGSPIADLIRAAREGWERSPNEDDAWQEFDALWDRGSSEERFRWAAEQGEPARPEQNPYDSDPMLGMKAVGWDEGFAAGRAADQHLRDAVREFLDGTHEGNGRFSRLRSALAESEQGASAALAAAVDHAEKEERNG